MQYTLGQLLLTFGRITYQRGLEYAENGKVLALAVEGNHISAKVRGSHGQFYSQSIEWKLKSDKVLAIDGVCTCPVAYNCKHVVAALIQLKRDSQGTDMLQPEPAGVRAALRDPQLAVTAPIAAWLSQVEAAAAAEPHQSPYAIPAGAGQGTTYRLVFSLVPFMLGTNRKLGLAVCKARLRRSGEIAAAEPVWDLNRFFYQSPSYVEEGDDAPLRLLSAMRGMYAHGFFTEPRGRLGAQIVRMLLEDARLFRAESTKDLEKGNLALLQPGAAQPAQLVWQEHKRQIRLAWQLAGGAESGAFLLDTEPPLYVADRHCGDVEFSMSAGMPPAQLRTLVRQAPAVDADCKEAVSRLLLAQGLEDIIPPPLDLPETVRDDVPMQPVLALDSVMLEGGAWADIAQLAFSYQGQRCDGTAKSLVRQSAQGIERILRNQAAEQAARDVLVGLGLIDASENAPQDYPHALALPDQDAWLKFARNAVPELERQGWRIEKLSGYRFDLADIEDWYADVGDVLGQSDNRWFDLELGVIVNGRRISLLPVLVESIRHAPQDFDLQALARRADDEELIVVLPGQVRVALPWGRIKPILQILGELYFTEKRDSVLRLSMLDAARMAELAGAARLRWMGAERLLRLGEKIRAFGGIAAVDLPRDWKAQLRPYQSEGVAWLQFLREYDLGGILADDMGLGKTVQTLAHILIEKEAGRLTQPALVVAPTSLMSNWEDEATRFAPSLRVLVLQGRERLERFDRIPQVDLVLTTYALLPRDEEKLREHTYHLVILDEAHYIKNPRAKAAQVAGLLPARHRLCLTGTPMENHLGELWSQFQFLLPGLLGDDKTFQRDFRTPIEKHGDDERRQFLMRRLKPFILRRTKDKVARELPPKTEMVRHVEISGAQRDLYETVRLAMDQKVRSEIARKGLARSHIVILEALLKLRQVCCDPRLLKSGAGKKIGAPSAKLTELLEMLDALLEDGRRILVFSQFTSMLALIELELNARHIPYALLTGDTQDRAAVVRRFQNGEVPLFLISLKAGGVGLNLTAADTVIHYDPWWNPAVENQATDRAWRIGQDKPVFVYKMIAKNTLEEKIQALQQKKSELAQAILGGGETSKIKITQEDLHAVFAPLHD